MLPFLIQYLFLKLKTEYVLGQKMSYSWGRPFEYRETKRKERELSVLGVKEDESDKVGWEQTVRDFVYQAISFVFIM